MKIILGLLLAWLVCGQAQAASSENKKHTNQELHVCSTLQKLLALRRGGRSPESVPKDFEVDWKESGGSTLYPNIDIDGDGINDQVVRSCGASLDSTCLLSVDLSSGKRLELEEARFFLARVRSSIYVIVGDTSEPDARKLDKRRVYRITKKNIKLICPHI